MKRLVLVALVAGGCHKTPAVCKDVGPAIAAWGKDEIANEKLTGDAAARRQKLFEVTAQIDPGLCEKDKWSGETIDCVIGAKTEEDAQHCPFTKDQRDSMQKALMDALGRETK
jgi:hypothetical protein